MKIDKLTLGFILAMTTVLIFPLILTKIVMSFLNVPFLVLLFFSFSGVVIAIIGIFCYVFARKAKKINH